MTLPPRPDLDSLCRALKVRPAGKRKGPVETPMVQSQEGYTYYLEEILAAIVRRLPED